MIVLVDCDSASASEIVAGALQDHDRALIVGTPTFGKGLVQTVFPLPQTSGLLLTTARYYTPTGRLIQRSYGNVSLWKYYSDPCSEAYEPETDDVRLTDNGRRVFGGGGITPDVRLAEPKIYAVDRGENDEQLRVDLPCQHARGPVLVDDRLDADVVTVLRADDRNAAAPRGHDDVPLLGGLADHGALDDLQRNR